MSEQRYGANITTYEAEYNAATLKFCNSASQ